MTEIVINECFGGFDLSHEGVLRYAELKGLKLFVKYELITHYYTKEPTGDDKIDGEFYFDSNDIPRDDPILVQVVKELREKSWTLVSQLKVVEIPNDVEWEIEEYDGLEHVSEVHRTWS